MRWTIVVVCALACGRIGFDARMVGDGARGGNAGDGPPSSAGDGGAGSDGSASPGTCPYVPCVAPGVGCCTGGVTTCISGPSCPFGDEIQCDLVTSQGCDTANDECCPGVGSSTICVPIVGGC